MKKGYHKTKDGRTVKKGLYYNINQAKKKEQVDRVKALLLIKH